MDYYFKSPIGRKAVKLHTVNVIEICNDEFQSIRSFSDSKEGNKRAEKLFKRLVREHNPKSQGAIQHSDEDLDAMIDDGVYDDDCGYQLLITHSI